MRQGQTASHPARHPIRQLAPTHTRYLAITTTSHHKNYLIPLQNR